MFYLLKNEYKYCDRVGRMSHKCLLDASCVQGIALDLMGSRKVDKRRDFFPLGKVFIYICCGVKLFLWEPLNVYFQPCYHCPKCCLGSAVAVRIPQLRRPSRTLTVNRLPSPVYEHPGLPYSISQYLLRKESQHSLEYIYQGCWLNEKKKEHDKKLLA